MAKQTTQILAAVAALALAAPTFVLAEEAEEAPPPAALAPAEGPVLGTNLSERMEEARRDLLEAERELREASAAVVRASRRRTQASELERLTTRQQGAQRAFDAARQRVPELVAQARAAGLSDAALRSWEHSLYGE